MITQRVVEISFHACVTPEKSFKVVPTYTKDNVLGYHKKQIRSSVVKSFFETELFSKLEPIIHGDSP